MRLHRKNLLIATISFICSLLLAVVVSEFYYFFQYNRWSFAVPRDRPHSSSSTVPGENFFIYRQPIPRSGVGKGRIVTLGGSTTFGMSLPDDATWPSQLGDLLKQQRDSFEIVNLGFLGAHLAQIRSHIPRLSKIRIARSHWELQKDHLDNPENLLPFGVREIPADIYLLAPIVNDTLPLLTLNIGLLTSFCSSTDTGFVRQLAVSRYICRLAWDASERKDIPSDEEINAVMNVFATELRQTVTEFQEMLSGRSSRVVLLSLPGLFTESATVQDAHTAARYWGRDSLEYRNELEYQAELYPKIFRFESNVMRAVSEELETSYIDLHNLFDSISFVERLPLFIDSIHTSREGAKKIAEALSKEFSHVSLP